MIHGGELAAERSMLPTRRWPIDVTAWPLENLNVLSTSEPGMSNDPLLRPQLKKTIGGLGFLSLAFGSMIGVGWITALGEWFQHAGPGGTMLAFAAGGLLMILIGSCYAELTPMLPVTGGEVAYAYRAFGTDKAFLVGWFLAFGYLGVSAFEAVSLGMVLAYLIPQLDVWPLYEIGEWTVYGPHLALAFLFTGIITTVNFLGVGLAMRLQVILTGLLVICALLFVAAGIGQGSPQNLVPHFAEDSLAGTWKGILIVFVMAPFMFVGFDTIPQAAEERAPGQPAARLGLYILLAIIGSTVFYVLVVLAAGMVTPWRSLFDEKLPTATAFRSAFASPALAVHGSSITVSEKCTPVSGPRSTPRFSADWSRHWPPAWAVAPCWPSSTSAHSAFRLRSSAWPCPCFGCGLSHRRWSVPIACRPESWWRAPQRQDRCWSFWRWSFRPAPLCSGPSNGQFSPDCACAESPSGRWAAPNGRRFLKMTGRE